MNVYKNYILQLKKQTFTDAYIWIGRDLTPLLAYFVHLLSAVKLETDCYFSLYGQLKRILTSFVVFHSETIDEVIKDADKYKHEVDKEGLLRLIDKTISTHHANQIAFGKEFLPVSNAEEKRVYEEVQSEFKVYMEKMDKLKEHVKKFDKKEQIDAFAAKHFERAVINRSNALDFTNIFISMMLADQLDDIRVSVEEIYNRLNNNLQQLKSESESSLNTLLQKLYEKNKEGLMQLRKERKSSIQNAEAMKSIQRVRNKIESFQSETTLKRLEEEVAYWHRKVITFHRISDNLIKLKAEQDYINEQEKIYNSLRSCDPPGTKRRCWKNMGLNYAERKEKVKQMIIREARSLVTFFAVRGYDRILYPDNKGLFYVDDFNHQIYVGENALSTWHVNCQGDFIQIKDAAYYFDNNGRYIIENGEKIYQCAPCTSHYKLGEDNLFKKTTKDCGHTEKQTKCNTMIKDPNIVTVLPDFLPMDIRKTLDAETVKYLWDSFGSILPDALYDVCMKKPRNPIHMLAHKLLYHKYSRTKNELKQKKKEAEQYRADVYKKRHEKAVAATLAWRSKQTKRRKPEESDDAPERDVFNAQQAERDFINSLNYYNSEM